MSKQTSWGVVGGGILGMELGRQLAGAGDQVTVFEAAAEPGGLAMTWPIAGTRWDKHYHVILPTDDRLVKLIEDIGLGDSLVWNKSSTGLFAGDTLHSVSSTAEFLRLPSLRLVDKFRLGITMLYASRVNNWRRLEKISAEKWLSRWSGKKTYREFWRPLLRSKLGDNADKASAAFIWAIMKRLYKARTSGAKVEKLGFAATGYGPVLDAMVDTISAAGVQLVTESRVESVATNPGGGATVTLADGTERAFDKAIVTTTAPVIADIVTELTSEERSSLEGIIYQGIVCVSLVLDRPLGGFYVTNITDDGFPFTGVIEMTAIPHSESIPPVWTSVPDVAIVSSAQILHGTLNVDETLGIIEAALPELRHGSPLPSDTKEVTNG